MRANSDYIPPLAASVTIAAAPEKVWAIVSDVRRMGEWSPQCRKVIVWGKEVRGGTWFTGINRRKLVVWATNCQVVRYDEGRAISWRVRENRARWSYEVADDDAGSTRLTERREMPDGVPPLAALFADRFLGGVEGHADEMIAGMQTTLERIKTVAEN